MRARSASLQHGCAGCLLAAAVAISTARCALDVERDADRSTTADRGGTVLREESSPAARGSSLPTAAGARDARGLHAATVGEAASRAERRREEATRPVPGVDHDVTARPATARGASEERRPRTPRRGLALSRPADDGIAADPAITRGAPGERGPRSPRRDLALSRPADDGIEVDPPIARCAPRERGPRVPRRGVGLSHPADVTRGLAAIRRHHGAFLVRADELPGRPSPVAHAADAVDPPRRPIAAPHRELLRRTVGL